MKFNVVALVVGAVSSAILILGIQYFFEGSGEYNRPINVENKPLYWVAPMDDGYRRDEPGLSPMGMALVPVYSNRASVEGDEGPGTITISPSIINNLGVRTAIVIKNSLSENIKTVGYVTYNEDTLVHIHPRIEGWIEALHVKAAGDPVKKGQPLYDIYSPALVNAQEEFVIAMDRNNKRLIQAAEDRLQSLQFPARQIKKLKKNKKVQQRVSFYSPQSGVIDDLNIRQGYFVKPGTSLMSIGSLDEIWVEAEIFERQGNQVKKDAAVTMTLDDLPGKVWAGNVDYIYPALDAITRTVKVRLRFNNKDRMLKPNMFAQVVIYTHDKEPVLLVPKESIIRTGSSDRVVLSLGEGRFKSIVVSVGRYDDKNAEILSGLNEGERVVTSAQFLLDSESSKTSDFIRLDSPVDDIRRRINKVNDRNVAINEELPMATTHGVINYFSKNAINITRNAIKKWNRPAATLNFIINDDIDLSKYKVNQRIQFTFTIHKNEFVITNLASDEKFNNDELPESIIKSKGEPL